MIVSGGLSSAAAARRAYEESGADAVMIARGTLGNPWVFKELTGHRTAPPSRAEVAEELLWVLDRAEEHLGTERAQRYLRKFYPWYFEGIGAGNPGSRRTAADRRPGPREAADRGREDTCRGRLAGRFGRCRSLAILPRSLIRGRPSQEGHFPGFFRGFFGLRAPVQGLFPRKARL